MACFYAVRLPAAKQATGQQLLDELARWLAEDCGHAFPQFSLVNFSSPLECSAATAQLTAVIGTMGESRITGVRLQSNTALSPSLPCPENTRLWADFFVEEQESACFVTLQLHCAPLTPGKPSGFPPLNLPEILWKLTEKGLLAADGGIPLSPRPLSCTVQLEIALQQLRSGGAFCCRPLLLVREGNYALTPTLSAQLCQCTHVILLPGMHPALSGLGAGSARILFPGLKVSRSVDLTAPSACGDIAEYAARLTTLSQPSDLPVFEQIAVLSKQQTSAGGDYLCMNRRMADSIRFYRLKSGLTQNDLAKKVSCTGLLISRLENCRPTRVRESLIVAIEEALHLKNREILACEGISSPDIPTPRPAFCPICGLKTAEIGDFCAGCGCKLC